MSSKLKLKIVTPERLVLEEEVDQVTLPTTEGEITVLPGHVALISTLKSGDIVARSNGEDIPMAVVSGFLELHNNEVTILADFAETVSEMTGEEIEKARARADELRTKQMDESDVNFEHFAAELERSLTRVRIADKWRTRKYRK